MNHSRGIHTGRPGAILGAGPSLPEDLKGLPGNTVLFSVNHHALKLVECDYAVYMDTHTANYLSGVKTISPWLGADIRITDGVMTNLTSPVASRIARIMDCAPVILCGMDLYQGDNYFYDAAVFPAGARKSLAAHLTRWRWVFKNCPHPEKIRAMSGPLTELFGKYDPEEEFMSDNDLVKIRVKRVGNVHLDAARTVHFTPGVRTVTDEQAQAAIKAGIATRIKEKRNDSAER